MMNKCRAKDGLAAAISGALLILSGANELQAQFTYTTNFDAITITGYTGPGGPVTIPSMITGLAVTKIDDRAFFGVTRIVALTIPETVTVIGRDCFYGCSSLGSVSLPNSITKMGEYALCQTALTNVTIPSSVTSFGYGMFQSCSNLSSAAMPDSIRVLPAWTFVYCPALKDVTLPPNLTSIADQAFRGCSSLMAIDIPGSVTNIGGAAFAGCSSLRDINIPTNVTSIGNGAFSGSGLASVFVPESVTNIGMQAFVGNNLSAILVADENPTYCSLDGVLFNKTRTTLVQYPRGKPGAAYAIPDGITIIGPWSFDGCSGLLKVIVPASVISIQGYGFSGCSSLTAAYFRGSTPSIYYGTSTFNGDNKVVVYYLPGTFGWASTFSGRPTVLWNPRMQTDDGNFGVRTNRFGFSVAGTSGLVVVVEACTNLSQNTWVSVGTNTLLGGSSYFSDPQSTSSAHRFYRLSPL